MRHQVVALLDVLGYQTSVQQCRLRIERMLAQPDSAGWCAVDGHIIGIAAGRLQWMLQADEPVSELSRSRSRRRTVAAASGAGYSRHSSSGR